MEKNNEVGLVSLFYKIDDNSLESIAKNSSTFLEIKEHLASEFQITGEGQYIGDIYDNKFELKVTGSMPNLREALQYIINSLGFPYKVTKPDFTSILGKKQTREEWKKEKKGYTLFKQILEEMGGKFRSYGLLLPEEGCASYSYITSK